MAGQIIITEDANGNVGLQVNGDWQTLSAIVGLIEVAKQMFVQGQVSRERPGASPIVAASGTVARGGAHGK